MPTLTVHPFPTRPEPRFHDGHWALLGFTAALPPAWLCLLSVLRPDLMDGIPRSLLLLPLACVPLTFLAQLVGFAACLVTGLKRWPLAAVTFIAWAVPFCLFTVPTLWGLTFMPIVWAFLFSRATG